MEVKNNGKHMIDILFVLSLFLFFAICSVILIILGADVYQKEVNHMENNFESRTSIAYLFEKVRQNDAFDSISLDTKYGNEVLKLGTNINDTDYAIWLYEYQGYLYELFTRTDLDLEPQAGQKIMEINHLNFKELSPKLYMISFENKEGEKITLYLSSHCEQYNSQENLNEYIN